MQVSKHFKHEELGIRNTSNYYITINMCALVYNVLEPLRKKLNEPIYITSGIRTEKENIEAGGVYNSQHLIGQAVDFKCKNIKKAFKILNEYREVIEYDQLIYYKKRRFIHISYSNNFNRNQIIIKQ